MSTKNSIKNNEKPVQKEQKFWTRVKKTIYKVVITAIVLIFIITFLIQADAFIQYKSFKYLYYPSAANTYNKTNNPNVTKIPKKYSLEDSFGNDSKNLLKDPNKSVITENTKNSSFIYYRQTENDCGSYAVTAAINLAYGYQKVSPEDTLKNIAWRFPGRFTLWQGLESEVEKNGLSKLITNISLFSEEDKLLYLQSNISQNRPVIMYIKPAGSGNYYRHFITLLGYDQSLEEYYFYDSLVPVKQVSDHQQDSDSNKTTLDNSLKNEKVEITIDENGDKPGNRTLSKRQLLQVWQDGNLFGLYSYYALVVKK